MKKIIFIFIYIYYNKNFSLDEYTLGICQSLSHSIYIECIKTPPITTLQISFCTEEYSDYIICLTELNLPYPLTFSYESIFNTSPFDICKYEVGRLINFDLCP